MKEKIIEFRTEKCWKLNFIDGIVSLMAVYELVCIFNPELTEKGKLVKKIEDWIEKIGGKVKKKEEWGRKELAYQIKKFSKGFYVFWQLKAEPSKINNLFPKIKLEENIIRHLLVRTG